MFEIGVFVEAIDEAISGVVVAVQNDTVTIETEDGFEMSYTSNQLVASENQLDLMQNSKMIYASKISDYAKKKQTNKPIKTKSNDFVFEVDLHIEKLVPTTKHLSNYDILNIQIDTAKRQLDFAISKRFPKLVFIHGVGEGVLKSDLRFMLGRYDNIRFQDANYQTYGLGATEVVILQR